MDIPISKKLRLLLSALMLLAFLAGCALMTEKTDGPSTVPPVVSTPVTTTETTAARTSAPVSAPTQTAWPTTIPETTVPETTVQETTIPETTIPETTVPETTVPETTIPETTVPETTVPETTVPETTVSSEPEIPFPELSAANAFVYNTRSGEFLYISCDPYIPIYPASITKLFTTYVAMQYLTPDMRITVGEERNMVIWDASVAGLRQGDTLTAEDLAKCTLLVSGCEASYTLAVAAGREILRAPNASAKAAIQAFMVQVNQTAAMLGMVNTNFVTPDGNHADDHYISMSAYATIAQCCLEDENLAAILATYSDTVSVTNREGKVRTLALRNTNENMNPNNTQFYRPETLGMKTGYTSKAGACLISAFRVEDGCLVVGVFGCPDYDSRFADAIALLEFFAQ